MNAKQLVELRKQAEKAVAEMPDGEIKLKAFEVILGHLLEGSKPEAVPSAEAEKHPRPKRDRAAPPTRSISGRILVLKDEGLFKNQRTIGEVREELRAHGWHYPLTALSGRLQVLVQQRKLRRERSKQGNKKVWKYSNY